MSLELIAETWASSGAAAPKQLVVMLFLATNADHDDGATIDVKPDAARCRLTPSDFVWTLTDLVSAGEITRAQGPEDRYHVHPGGRK